MKPQGKWYELVVLEQDENYLIVDEDVVTLKGWWSKFIIKQIYNPFLDFFRRLTGKINETADFYRLFKENSQKIQSEYKRLIFKTRERNENFYIFIENIYMESIKKSLFNSVDKQQKQKRLYDLVIRDMKIVEMIKVVSKPFLKEIADRAFLNDYLFFQKNMKTNQKFFNEMKGEIAMNVTKVLDIYKEECMRICLEFF